MNPFDPPAPFEARIFEFLASTGAAGVHAHGTAATELLIERLSPAREDAILEVGCGTGHTLAVVFGRFGTRVTGVDANASMMRACRRRLRFCGIADQIELVRADVGHALPFKNESFDKVYCESVLAFQSADNLETALKEIHRVLKRGGRFVANETLWLTDAVDEDIDRWNEQCVANYGMVQADPSLKGPGALGALLTEAGFNVQPSCAFDRHSPAAGAMRRLRSNRIEYRSHLYSRWRLVLSGVHPVLLWRRFRIRRRQHAMTRTPQLMEGWLVAAEKA